MTTQYIRYPSTGGGGITTYANFAALPASANDGAAAVTLDTDTIYIFNLATVTWRPVANPGDALGIGTIDSNTPNANGITIDGTSNLIMQSASGTVPGLMNLAAQTLAGVKTFSSAPKLSSLTASLPLQLDASKNIISSLISLTAGVTGVLPIANGGTNSSTVLSNNRVIVSAAGAIGEAAAITASSALASNANGIPVASATTSTELGFVNGVTSAIQTQLNAKQSTLTPGSISTSTTGVTVGSGASSTVGPNVTVNVQTASTSQPGLLSAADWTTFNNKQATLTIGNLTDVGTDGIIITGGTGAVIGAGASIAQTKADATHNGYLSSTDWSTFNGKQAAGNYITALTGDATASGPGSVALTLATVNSNVGSFGSSTSIPSFTVNAKGLVTAASGNVVIAPAGTLSGTTLNSTVVTSSLTALGTISTGVWQGTVVAVGFGGTGLSSAGTSGNILTSNGSAWVSQAPATVSLTTGVSGVLPLGNGGTGQSTKAPAFDALSPMTTGGDIIYGGASGTGTRLANGSAGQFLQSQGGTAAPAWASGNAFLVVVSKTANYTAAAGDDLILCSTNSFTVTLPTAVGVTGKIYRVKKTDADVTKIITIATTSSQTIDGVTTKTLNTQYEEYMVVSDGSNWQMLDHYMPSVWVAYTPTFTAFGTATSINFVSRRNGSNLEIQGTFTSGTTTGSTCSISLGFGGTNSNVTAVSTYPGISLIGTSARNVSNNETINILIGTSDTAISFARTTGSASNLSKQAGNVICANGDIVSLYASVQIAGWNT